MALALARPMARMQVEVERQIQMHRRSPVADLVSLRPRGAPMPPPPPTGSSLVSVHTQLPHLPHISEGLVRRNLRRGDMRDMSLGQLQVISNDFHAQIQGE